MDEKVINDRRLIKMTRRITTKPTKPLKLEGRYPYTSTRRGFYMDLNNGEELFIPNRVFVMMKEEEVIPSSMLKLDLDDPFDADTRGFYFNTRCGESIFVPNNIIKKIFTTEREEDD